ncbi:MAG: hypothetical protein C0467_09895 [Planctomycetaceae bacterium]|nr:hypothetical protein [Planctomycetaceae bacterium]
MSETELTELENTIPALAVRALNDAHQRARASGCPVVLVVNDQLVQIGPEGTTVLKDMPPWVEAPVRKKRATT